MNTNYTLAVTPLIFRQVQSQILNCVDDISYDTINTVFYNTPWDDDMHGPTPVEQRLGIPVSPEYFQTLTQPQLAQDVEDIGDRSYSEVSAISYLKCPEPWIIKLTYYS